MFVKTNLDLDVEKIEKQYGSVTKAPASALHQLHRKLESDGYEIGRKHIYQHHSGCYLSSYVIVRLIKHHYYTNSKTLCKVSDYIRSHQIDESKALRYFNFPQNIFYLKHIPYWHQYTYTDQAHRFHCTALSLIALCCMVQALHSRYSFLPYHLSYYRFLHHYRSHVTGYYYMQPLYYVPQL